MCDICDWEALHPGETWPPPRIPEYGPPIDVGGPMTIRIAGARTLAEFPKVTAVRRTEKKD